MAFDKLGKNDLFGVQHELILKLLLLQFSTMEGELTPSKDEINCSAL